MSYNATAGPMIPLEVGVVIWSAFALAMILFYVIQKYETRSNNVKVKKE